MEALVGFINENNIYVKTNNFYIEMHKTLPMTDILGVKEWDCNGYIVLATNYGDEYYEIQEYLKMIFTKKEIKNLGWNKPLDKVTSFKIKHKEKNNYITRSEYLDKATLTVDEIALIVSKDKKSLIAVDLRNTNSKMKFKLSQFNEYVLDSSTFKDGKRKYQTLFVVKCNEKLVQEI